MSTQSKQPIDHVIVVEPGVLRREIIRPPFFLTILLFILIQQAVCNKLESDKIFNKKNTLSSSSSNSRAVKKNKRKETWKNATAQ